MGMASKGPRKGLTVRIPEALYDVLEDRRQAAGVSSVSQYISDLLADQAGRSDLVMELDQEVLSLTAYRISRSRLIRAGQPYNHIPFAVQQAT